MDVYFRQQVVMSLLRELVEAGDDAGALVFATAAIDALSAERKALLDGIGDDITEAFMDAW